MAKTRLSARAVRDANFYKSKRAVSKYIEGKISMDELVMKNLNANRSAWMYFLDEERTVNRYIRQFDVQKFLGLRRHPR